MGYTPVGERPRFPLPFFILRYLVDLVTRPGRGWLVQQLRGGWFGLCPGRVVTINNLDKTAFSLPEEVKRGELRPFYNPNDPANII